MGISCEQIITSLPFTIAAEGIYCLSDNIRTTMNSGNAITILADDVILDLCGHCIDNRAAGPGSSANGIYARAPGRTFKNVTVNNGTVCGFDIAVFLHANLSGEYSGSIVERLRVLENRNGIMAEGLGNLVRDNVVAGAREVGILVRGHTARVINNDVLETKSDTAGGRARSIEVNMSLGAVVDNNRVANTSYEPGTSGIEVVDSGGVAVRNNSVANMVKGISFDGYSWGIYEGNIVSGSAQPFTNGTPAGSSNYSIPRP